ncbi:uncharacterized protein LOC125230934 [Leguminivora glycinivorella]|uniref:uncharacterized protein LOC125230934 n=1 Tax=Leguminivora glycinivorella TaxID=1035111 RepID=UPI00200DEE42|nr:uncharacterized protein LOC125230934 [Leguminivora glycinivorella]
MEEKAFLWTTELTKKLLELRFQNDWLFKKKKQPWAEFRSILLENGYPETMTLNHVRKKWSYTYDCYKVAKKTRNKSWKYYKMFEKHYGKTTILDKYESWDDEWRLKLVICISEAKEMKVEYQHFWRTVETAMRSQELPADCCVQDMKGLWQHIITTFNRKYRQKLKKDVEISWPLFDAMLCYYQRFDPEYLVRLETETPLAFFSRCRKSTKVKKVQESESDEFQWSKDITETFIQIRLQNDWLFRERKWAWNDLLNIMKQEYGFPDTLNGREICRKWAATFGEYQKSKATNNKSWLYYNLFELYLGEERLSLNPLKGWQEEWVLNLISARTEQDYLFRYTKYRDQSSAWREVEKKLRSMGLPIDHSLLDLEEMWMHLLKTFRWKRKFANKGILNEQWAYFDAMAQYEVLKSKPNIKQQKDDHYDHEDQVDHIDQVDHDNDFEDDIKLLDLKQRLNPKIEVTEKQCRSCFGTGACIDLHRTDEEGVDLASKLRVIGGIEMDKSDKLPWQICLHCLSDLEHAYKFRRKCQDVDKHFRDTKSIKLETIDNLENNDINNRDEDMADGDTHFGDFESEADMKQEKKLAKSESKKILVRKKKKMRKMRYDYWKVCEICGKHTRNLRSHLDMHSAGKFYSCDVCDKRFKFKSGLVIHKAVHDPTPKKTCEVCGKTFHILAQYRRHFVHHANQRNHECDTCGKRFNTSDILTVHKRTHTDERPFSCDECWKTFRTAGCVSRHKRIVHRKAVKNQ